MDKLPLLLRNYVMFCKYRSEAMDTGKLDLSGLSFIFPTTLLPLTDLVLSEKPFRILPPKNEVVADYIEYMLDGNAGSIGSRMPSSA